MRRLKPTAMVWLIIIAAFAVTSEIYSQAAVISPESLYFGQIPGLEMVYPMAIVVLGGMISTALVSLYVLPALYLWLKEEPLPDIVSEPITVDDELEPAAAT